MSQQQLKQFRCFITLGTSQPAVFNTSICFNHYKVLGTNFTAELSNIYFASLKYINRRLTTQKIQVCTNGQCESIHVHQE